MRTSGQTDQVIRVRQRKRLIEIVNTPDNSSFLISPSAKVLNMQISNRQDGRCACKRCTLLSPHFNPAIKCGPHEREDVGRHLLMFQLQISFNQPSMDGEPGFIRFRSLFTIHVYYGADDLQQRARTGEPISLRILNGKRQLTSLYLPTYARQSLDLEEYKRIVVIN